MPLFQTNTQSHEPASPLRGVGRLNISVSNLSKTYENGKVRALDDVSFSVDEGEIFGLIGPDGAGKTSIFRILTTLLIPDSGKASVLGYDVVKDFRKIRNEIGYMPGRFSLYPDLSVAENLNFYARLFGTTIEANYHLIRDIYVQIEPFKKRKAGQLSGGMKQKLALCCALIHKPKVLFLDEPTTGIDPVSRKELWEMLRKLKDEGICIFVSTPYMDEAVKCDRIALIQQGVILKTETPEAIVKQYDKPIFAVGADNTYQLLKVLEQYPNRLNSYAFGEFAHLVTNGNEDELSDFLEKKGLKDITINRI
ncbi:MAG: ABC transporter ATP-binding protein, partial [Bacteroidia bacterium]|nr:ABC transporter ATP-binding protein [Bacteroidia bacterium]